MHRRPLNLAAGVIPVPKLSKYTSRSPNLLIASYEIQTTVTLVKQPLTWTDMWGPHVSSTSLLPLPPTPMAGSTTVRRSPLVRGQPAARRALPASGAAQ